MGQDEGIAAHCPRCGADYSVFSDAPRWQRMRSDAGEPVVHDCYECSLKNTRRPWIWVPTAGLIVMTFPLLWMLWSHIVGPALVVAAFGYYVWEWIRRKLPRRAAAPEKYAAHDAEKSHPRVPGRPA